MIENFPYIKTIDFTGDIKLDVKSLLCVNNKYKTYEHCKAVAETNIKIAKKFGLEQDICEIAGYLHDISAVILPDDMLCFAENNNMQIYEAERKYPFLLHQRISRIIAEQDFNITDKHILDSIECHTTLKSAPSLYDMALFVADKLSWDKDGLPPFYEAVKNKLEISLEAASLAYMEWIVKNKMLLYPHTWFEDGINFLQKSA